MRFRGGLTVLNRYQGESRTMLAAEAPRHRDILNKNSVALCLCASVAKGSHLGIGIG